MTPDEILNHLIRASLDTWDSVETVRAKVKHLAHYTSVNTLRSICLNNEIWLSNPLFMNDLQELNYGVDLGYRYVMQSNVIERALKCKSRADYARQQFGRFVESFVLSGSNDVYIFCLSEHDIQERDGVLSMWRTYGDKGAGAALVLNTGFLRDGGDSPLLIAKVHYKTDDQRRESVIRMVNIWVDSLLKIEQSGFTEHEINACMQSLFLCIEMQALTTKHEGFREEKEWRLIYTRDTDPKHVLTKRLSYNLSITGAEPKLKFPLEPMPLDPIDTWTFDSILDQIILGPGMSRRLNKLAVERMLCECQKPAFLTKLCISTIPLRL